MNKYDMRTLSKITNRIKSLAQQYEWKCLYVSLIVWKWNYKTISIKSRTRMTEWIEACVSNENKMVYEPYGCDFKACSHTHTHKPKMFSVLSFTLKRIMLGNDSNKRERTTKWNFKRIDEELVNEDENILRRMAAGKHIGE